MISDGIVTLVSRGGNPTTALVCFSSATLFDVVADVLVVERGRADQDMATSCVSRASVAGDGV